MVRSVILLFALVWAVTACDDGAAAGADAGQGATADVGPGAADSGRRVDGGRQRADFGAAPDAAPIASIDCELICQRLAHECANALTVRGNCNSCADILEGLEGDAHVQTYALAAQICAEAQRSVDCRALSACISDDQGLSAVAAGVNYRLSGTVGGVELDLEGADAWAYVGTKKDGSPSDLEVVFETADTLWLVVIDDLAVDPMGASLAKNVLTVRSTAGSVLFETGTLTVEAFDLAGGFDLDIEGAAGPDSEDTVRFTVSGRFR